MTASDAPLIGIPASTGIAPNAHTLTHRVSDKYIEAAIELSGCLPLMIPAIGDRIDISRLTARFDGILLTGGRANVEPHQYDGPPSIEGTVHDPARDQTTLPLLRELSRSTRPDG